MIAFILLCGEIVDLIATRMHLIWYMSSLGVIQSFSQGGGSLVIHSKHTIKHQFITKHTLIVTL